MTLYESEAMHMQDIALLESNIVMLEGVIREKKETILTIQKQIDAHMKGERVRPGEWVRKAHGAIKANQCAIEDAKTTIALAHKEIRSHMSQMKVERRRSSEHEAVKINEAVFSWLKKNHREIFNEVTRVAMNIQHELRQTA